MALNDWMSALDDNRKLNSLSIPGSHDACMYWVKPGDSRWRVDAAITQFNDIGQQLTDGTRYFDIRVYLDGVTLRAGHFQSKDQAQEGRGSFGPRFQSVIDDIVNFLTANNQEVLILKISLATDAVTPAIQMMRQHLKPFMFKSTTIKTLADFTLGQCRGKAICIFDKVLLPGGDNFKARLHLARKKTPKDTKVDDSMGEERRSVMFLNGDAPTADNIDDVLSKQNKKRKENIKKGLTTHMEMFYLTITAGISTAIGAGGFGMSGSQGRMCIADNTAREIGLTGVPAVPAYTNTCKYSNWQVGAGAAYAVHMIKAKGIGLPVNIFMYDFVNAEVNQVIVDRN